jgi:Rps23 Pro-64 3,4-dihydroxylase Tpa1-like proline 4-hydroxylase
MSLDDREIQLAVYDGKGEYYLRHKDDFRLDPNNIQDGAKMRKITVIAYLNPDINKVLENKGNKAGDLRLYL